jgi:hypothetical protein
LPSSNRQKLVSAPAVVASPDTTPAPIVSVSVSTPSLNLSNSKNVEGKTKATTPDASSAGSRVSLGFSDDEASPINHHNQQEEIVFRRARFDSDNNAIISIDYTKDNSNNNNNTIMGHSSANDFMTATNHQHGTMLPIHSETTTGSTTKRIIEYQNQSHREGSATPMNFTVSVFNSSPDVNETGHSIRITNNGSGGASNRVVAAITSPLPGSKSDNLGTGSSGSDSVAPIASTTNASTITRIGADTLSSSAGATLGSSTSSSSDTNNVSSGIVPYTPCSYFNHGLCKSGTRCDKKHVCAFCYDPNHFYQDCQYKAKICLSANTKDKICRVGSVKCDRMHLCLVCLGSDHYMDTCTVRRARPFQNYCFNYNADGYCRKSNCSKSGVC